MDINYFKEFTVLAETRNFWEASERLFLNQSTLSKHIKAMERELGVPLFARTTRKVELTEFGRALLPYARTITKTQFEYASVLLQKKQSQRNLLTIGTIPSMAQYQITNLLLDYRRTYPECHVKIIENDASNLKALLSEKKCELIFLREPKRNMAEGADADDTLVRIPYVSDYLVAVLPSSHPLANRSELTLRELQQESFCFLKENTMIYDLCCLACQEAGFIPNIIFDSHSLESILAMVAQGCCTALLMNHHVPALTCTIPDVRPPLIAVKIVPAVSTQISLCYCRELPLSSAAGHFIELLQSSDHLTER